MSENLTGERCPSREAKVDAMDQSIWDSSIPEECLRCLDRARRDGTAVVRYVDRYDEAVRALKASFDGKVDPEDTNKWSSTEMRIPDGSDEREIILSLGFDDSAGDSYGIESEATTTYFTCDK